MFTILGKGHSCDREARMIRYSVHHAMQNSKISTILTGFNALSFEGFFLQFSALTNMGRANAAFRRRVMMLNLQDYGMSEPLNMYGNWVGSKSQNRHLMMPDPSTYSHYLTHIISSYHKLTQFHIAWFYFHFFGFLFLCANQVIIFETLIVWTTLYIYSTSRFDNGLKNLIS